MAWTNPKTNWAESDSPQKADLNRIEGNIAHLKELEAANKAPLASACTAMNQPAVSSDSYETLAGKIRAISTDATAGAENVLAGKTFYSGGVKRTGTWPGPMFGTGGPGDFSSTGNVVVPVPEALNNRLVVLDYASFVLNANHTLSTADILRALVIRCTGNITINGTINLDKRGGLWTNKGRYITIGGVQYDLAGGHGGNGGAGGHGTMSEGWGGDGGIVDDYPDTDYCTGGTRGGGGGGGGAYAEIPTYYWWAGGGDGGWSRSNIYSTDDPQYGGQGGLASAGANYEGGYHGFPGGVGGGGAAINAQDINAAWGGYGGGTYQGGSGGGGGAAILFSGYNNAIADDGAASPGEYGGGVLILIAGGNVVINGQILARGGKGGKGGNAKIVGSSVEGGAGGGGGGGGSGGGRVLILHRGSYSLGGSIAVTGGAGGAPGSSAGSGITAYSGGGGGTGSVQVTKLQS